jgi:hypothetical protein
LVVSFLPLDLLGGIYTGEYIKKRFALDFESRFGSFV